MFERNEFYLEYARLEKNVFSHYKIMTPLTNLYAMLILMNNDVVA